MRMLHIMKAVDGTADWPEQMSNAEVVFAALVYAVTGVALMAGAWASYVILWAVFG